MAPSIKSAVVDGSEGEEEEKDLLHFNLLRPRHNQIFLWIFSKAAPTELRCFCPKILVQERSAKSWSVKSWSVKSLSVNTKAAAKQYVATDQFIIIGNRIQPPICQTRVNFYRLKFKSVILYIHIVELHSTTMNGRLRIKRSLLYFDKHDWFGSVYCSRLKFVDCRSSDFELAVVFSAGSIPEYWKSWVMIHLKRIVSLPMRRIFSWPRINSFAWKLCKRIDSRDCWELV